MEQEIVQQMSASPMRFRPIDHDWCQARSAPDKGSYFFCDWLTGPDCDMHSPAASGSRTAAPADVNGAGRTPASALAIKDVRQPDACGTSEWVIPLGRKCDIKPILHPEGNDLELDYEVVPASEDSFKLRGKGLTQTILIFGGPGAGKTYFFKYLIERLLRITPKPGLLLLDPKGVLGSWIEQACGKSGRVNDLVVVSVQPTTSFNVLGRFLTPPALGRLLSDVILAESPEVDQGWAVLLIDLLQSACTVIAHQDGIITARGLLEDTLFQKPYVDHQGNGLRLYPVEARVRSLLAHASSDTPLPADVKRACIRIQDYFTSTEDKQRRFVRQIAEASLGELVSDEWAHLSDTKSDADPYDEIIHDGKIVAVSIGQGSPAFQRSLSTLIKALYQQRALLALNQGRADSGRLSILACDEYAQVITEGTSGLVSDARFFSLAREAGCMNLFALQSIATARSRFPQDMRDRWEGILGNVGIRFFMGLNDVETAQLGSSLAGDRDRVVRIASTTQSASGVSVAESNNMIKAAVVPHWFLTNRMPTGLVMVQGKLDGRSAPVLGFFVVPETTNRDPGDSP